MNKNGICKSAGNQFGTRGYGGERIKQQPYSWLLDINCIRYENIVFSTRNDSNAWVQNTAPQYSFRNTFVGF